MVEAVRLSARYIPSRQLPDKAVSLIDTACARAAMSQAAIPAPIEDLQRRIALIDTEIGILQRERASGADHAKRIVELNEERLTRERPSLARWRALVSRKNALSLRKSPRRGPRWKHRMAAEDSERASGHG